MLSLLSPLSRTHALHHLAAGTTVIVSLMLGACGGTSDSSPSPSEVAQLLASAAAADTSPSNQDKRLAGVTYGMDNGAMQVMANAGVRKLGETAVLQKTDLMMIGSTTKAMTASIVGRLVDRHVLSWDTKITDAIPAARATMLPAYANITIEQLLAHRGGMLALDGDDFAAFETFLQSYQGELPQDERGRRLLFSEWALTRQPPTGVTPGVTFLYSNADYTVVGAMLEALTGKTYQQLWAEEVGTPLGISAKWIRPELTGSPAAWGHDGLPGHLVVEPTPAPENQAWYDVIAPAGLITIAPTEYAKWIHWHVLALRGDATPLAASYIARVKAVNTQNNYAVGWSSTTVNGRPCVGHGGSWFGFMSYVAIDMDGSRAIWGMTNTYWEDETGNWPIDVMRKSAAAMDRNIRFSK